MIVYWNTKHKPLSNLDLPLWEDDYSKSIIISIQMNIFYCNHKTDHNFLSGTPKRIPRTAIIITQTELLQPCHHTM